MDVDLRAIAHAYASIAGDYDRTFGDDLDVNEFDSRVVDTLIAAVAPGATVLDVGCGPAQVSRRVRQAGRIPVAVDLTPEMLLIARSGALQALICADLRQLPIATAAADAVVCWYSLHNLPREAIAGALDELHRTLRPGGRILVGTHEGEGADVHTSERDGHPEHVVVTYYAEPELHDLMGRAGFGAVESCRRGPMPHEHQVDKLYVSAVAA